MKKIKAITGIAVFLINCGIMDCVDSGVLGLRWALYLLLADLVLLAIFNANKKKKSATRAECSGHATHRVVKEHIYYNTKHRGVSR